MKNLEQELCAHICDVCRVKGIDCGTVDKTAPLIGPESILGLDSLDAMEIVVMVQTEYDVRIGSEETSREILVSLTTLADYVRANSDLYSQA